VRAARSNGQSLAAELGVSRASHAQEEAAWNEKAQGLQQVQAALYGAERAANIRSGEIEALGAERSRIVQLLLGQNHLAVLLESEAAGRLKTGKVLRCRAR